jgi:signal transduction histidine kinase
LDILLPDLDGFETCRRVKANPKTEDIPVIFMTALDNVRDLVTGFEVGAVDYITKPFSPEEVLARVTTHLTLQYQRKALWKLSVQQQKFFTHVAHDMKEVLSSLVSLSDFLVMSASEIREDHIQKAAKMVVGSVHSAIKLLENLSNWVKIQNGTLEFHPEMLDLQELVLENIVMLRSQARDKQIELSHSIQSDTFVYTDYDIASMILHNLLMNAVWFTNTGGKVHVSANVANRFVEVAIADTGIGISQEHLPKLFNIDQKFRTHGTRGEHGTGLGLVLCKNLVEMNGGEIRVESRIDHGSTFTFTLPTGK